MSDRARRPVRLTYRRVHRSFRESRMLSLAVSVVLAGGAVDLALYAAVTWLYYPVLFLGVAGTAYCLLHYGESKATSNDSPVRSFFQGLSVSWLVVAVTGGSGELRSEVVAVAAVASVYSFVVLSTAVSVTRSESIGTE